jgi:hypothetical protein
MKSRTWSLIIALLCLSTSAFAQVKSISVGAAGVW